MSYEGRGRINKSTFKELDRLKLTHDKNVVISLKENRLTKDLKISIAQGVTIIPEGKTEQIEIFYPHALTLSLQQVKDFVNKLQTQINLFEEEGKKF